MDHQPTPPSVFTMKAGLLIRHLTSQRLHTFFLYGGIIGLGLEPIRVQRTSL